MRIGAALALIAVGAILRFGIAVTMTHGFDLQIIGDILIGVGLLGLILWLIVQVGRADGHGPVPLAAPPTRWTARNAIKKPG